MLAWMACPARAATVMTNIGDSGWTATFSGSGPCFRPQSAQRATQRRKSRDLHEASAGEGLLITFTQTSSSAKPVIDFTDESITNVTGESWSGFDFILLNSGNSSASFASNLNSPFSPPSGVFSTESTTTIDGNPAVVYGGGTQANLATSLWGIGTDGDLMIDADPLGLGTTFTFKEVPVDGSTPPVPLPAALWQGLAGLAGLALVTAAKRLRRHPAE